MPPRPDDDSKEAPSTPPSACMPPKSRPRKSSAAASPDPIDRARRHRRRRPTERSGLAARRRAAAHIEPGGTLRVQMSVRALKGHPHAEWSEISNQTRGTPGVPSSRQTDGYVRGMPVPTTAGKSTWTQNVYVAQRPRRRDLEQTAIRLPPRTWRATSADWCAMPTWKSFPWPPGMGEPRRSRDAQAREGAIPNVNGPLTCGSISPHRTSSLIPT